MSTIHSFHSDLWKIAGTPWGQVVDTRLLTVEDGRPAGDERTPAPRGRAVDDTWTPARPRWNDIGVTPAAVEDVDRRPQSIHGPKHPLTCEDALFSTVPQALRV